MIPVAEQVHATPQEVVNAFMNVLKASNKVITLQKALIHNLNSIKFLEGADYDFHDAKIALNGNLSDLNNTIAARGLSWPPNLQDDYARCARAVVEYEEATDGPIFRKHTAAEKAVQAGIRAIEAALKEKHEADRHLATRVNDFNGHTDQHDPLHNDEGRNELTKRLKAIGDDIKPALKRLRTFAFGNESTDQPSNADGDADDEDSGDDNGDKHQGSGNDAIVDHTPLPGTDQHQKQLAPDLHHSLAFHANQSLNDIMESLRTNENIPGTRPHSLRATLNHYLNTMIFNRPAAGASKPPLHSVVDVLEMSYQAYEEMHAKGDRSAQFVFDILQEMILMAKAYGYKGLYKYTLDLDKKAVANIWDDDDLSENVDTIAVAQRFPFEWLSFLEGISLADSHQRVISRRFKRCQKVAQRVAEYESLAHSTYDDKERAEFEDLQRKFQTELDHTEAKVFDILKIVQLDGFKLTWDSKLVYKNKTRVRYCPEVEKSESAEDRALWRRDTAVLRQWLDNKAVMEGNNLPTIKALSHEPTNKASTPAPTHLIDNLGGTKRNLREHYKRAVALEMPIHKTQADCTCLICAPDTIPSIDRAWFDGTYVETNPSRKDAPPRSESDRSHTHIVKELVTFIRPEDPSSVVLTGRPTQYSTTMAPENGTSLPNSVLEFNGLPAHSKRV